MKPYELLVYLFALTNWPFYPIQASRLMIFFITLRLYLRDGQCADLSRRQFRLFIVLKALHYAYALFLTGRIVYASYLLSNNLADLEAYTQIDTLLGHLLQYGILFKHTATILSLAFVFLFILYFDYILTFQASMELFQYNYAHVNINRLHFLQLNAPFAQAWTQLGWNVREWSNFAFYLWSSSKASFFMPIIAGMPNLSANLRIRLIVLTYILEVLGLILNLLAVAVSFVALSVYAYFNLSTLYLGKTIFAVLDFALLSIIMCATIRYLLFCLVYVSSFVLLTYAHMSQLKIDLTGTLTSLRLTNNRNPLLLAKLQFQLHKYRHDQHRLLQASIIEDRDVSSPLLFACFLTTTVVNLLFLSQLFHRNLPSTERAFILITTGVQSLFVYYANMCMITVSNSLSSAALPLYQAQLVLRSKNVSGGKLLQCKLKLLSDYEQVHSSKRFAFNFGPMGKITKWAFIKFLFLYMTFLLKVMKRTML